MLQDQFQRPLQDLRISVTDRCNFRCGYCMPREAFGPDHTFLPHAELLSFEEITRVATRFVDLGVRKIRLTGGEPLLRKGIETLIEQLASIPSSQAKPLDLTLTTNGLLLGRKARSLRDAGLRRVTVSLDSLDPTVFRKMSDTDWDVSVVLAGIEAAQTVGLEPIKVNMVVQRGVNEDQILPMARHFKGSGIELRFIEYMDVGTTNGWSMEHVVTSAETRKIIESEFALKAADACVAGVTSKEWDYADGTGRIGFVSSVTEAFCGDCTRMRLSTDGKLYTCLFATEGHDLRHVLRSRADNAEIDQFIRAVWQGRSDRYSVLRAQSPQHLVSPPTGRPVIPIIPSGSKRIEMSYIGG